MLPSKMPKSPFSVQMFNSFLTDLTFGAMLTSINSKKRSTVPLFPTSSMRFTFINPTS